MACADQITRQRRIDAARQADDGVLDAHFADFIAQEGLQDGARQIGIDVQFVSEIRRCHVGGWLLAVSCWLMRFVSLLASDSLQFAQRQFRSFVAQQRRAGAAAANLRQIDFGHGQRFFKVGRLHHEIAIGIEDGRSAPEILPVFKAHAIGMNHVVAKDRRIGLVDRFDKARRSSGDLHR